MKALQQSILTVISMEKADDFTSARLGDPAPRGKALHPHSGAGDRCGTEFVSAIEKTRSNTSRAAWREISDGKRQSLTRSEIILRLSSRKRFGSGDIERISAYCCATIHSRAAIRPTSASLLRFGFSIANSSIGVVVIPMVGAIRAGVTSPTPVRAVAGDSA